MNFCQYKNIFGEPNTNIHMYCVMDIAIVDVLGTIIGAIIIAKIFDFNIMNTIICSFMIGILLHRLFCVRTTVDKILFS